jgi:protein transport protein SEC24
MPGQSYGTPTVNTPQGYFGISSQYPTQPTSNQLSNIGVGPAEPVGIQPLASSPAKTFTAAGQPLSMPPQPQAMQQMGIRPLPQQRMPSQPGSYPVQGQFHQAGGPAQIPRPGYPQPGIVPPGRYQQPGAYQGVSSGYAGPTGYVQQKPPGLDPDMVPNTTAVWREDLEKYSGKPFETDSKGVVPPLAATDFSAVDKGICNPKFIRSTLYGIPNSPDLVKQTLIPLGLIISPLAQLKEDETSPAVVDFSVTGPPRCVRCKAYMSPFMKFVDGGRRFTCPLCKGISDVPQDYMAYLDNRGERTDKYQRPELFLGSYEFLVSKEYCRESTLPNHPAFIFVIDVSYNNMKNGLVTFLCSYMNQILENIPRENDDTLVDIGFITFSDEVHFWDFSHARPRMIALSDLLENFIPQANFFLVNPIQAKNKIDQLMKLIPQLYTEDQGTQAMLGPAIEAGMKALTASNKNGKLLVFQSTLPEFGKPGGLKVRDDRKLLGTDKEKNILAPQITYYNDLAQKCAELGVGVDLYLANPSFIDVATLAQISRLSGGTVYKYTYFLAEKDGQRLLEDCVRSVRFTSAFDVVMRLRTSTGLNPCNFYGSYFMSNSSDVEMGAMDSNKAITVEIKYEDKIQDEEAYFQLAFLYTSLDGKRRVRIHNLALPTVNQFSDVYKLVDSDALINLMLKQAVSTILDSSPKGIRENMIKRVAQILANYRKNTNTQTNTVQLILPEQLKLLPLFSMCLIKNDALSGALDIVIDDRALAMHIAQTMDARTSLFFLYPRLLPIHQMQDPNKNEGSSFPAPIRCSYDRMKQDAVYILENGVYMFIWIGSAVSNEWLRDVLGVNSFNEIGLRFEQLDHLPELDNPMSEWVRSVVDQILDERPRSMKMTFAKPHDKMEIIMKRFLVEDFQDMNNTGMSYTGFLPHLHKEIKQLSN